MLRVTWIYLHAGGDEIGGGARIPLQDGVPQPPAPRSPSTAPLDTYCGGSVGSGVVPGMTWMWNQGWTP